MIKAFFWLLVMIGSVIGGFVFLFGLVTAKSAPQEAAAAASGIAFAVIPYCLARAVSQIQKKEPGKIGEEMNEKLERIAVFTELANKKQNLQELKDKINK